MLCLCEKIRFCQNIEHFLQSDSVSTNLKKYLLQLNNQLQKFSEKQVEDYVLRLKLKSLTFDLIHHIDIVQQLLKSKKLFVFF